MRARFEVRAVAHGDRQPLLDQPHAFDRDAVGHRVKERRAIGFEIVRERIHADRRGHLRRQADREFRIRDHERRQHPRMKDDLLGVIAHVGDDGRAARPRSRSRPSSARRRRAPCRRRSRACTSPRDPRNPRSAASARPSARSPCQRRARCRRRMRSRRRAAARDTPRRRRDVRLDRVRLHVGEHLARRARRRGTTPPRCAIIGSAARPGSVTSSGRCMPSVAAGVGQLARCGRRRSGCAVG